MEQKIRAPGTEFPLTDEELLAAPPRMLSKTQRQARRALKRDYYQQVARERREERRTGRAARLKKCLGYTKMGDPCDKRCMNGATHCRSHLNDAERKKLGIKSPEEVRAEMKARVKPQKRVTGPVLMREVTEVAVEKLVHRYFLAVGLEFIGFDVEGNPIVIDKGVKRGICLHGESKDGYVHMSEYPDLGAQIAVMEKLLDRVYGRPKQTQVLEGGTKPVQIEPVRTVERAQGMAELLRRSGALPPAEEDIIEGEAREADVVPIDIDRGAVR